MKLAGHSCPTVAGAYLMAPPISVIFKLFFVASLFGILAGVLIIFYQNTIFDPSTVGAISVVHTLTLGVMASFMMGALFQMLPVIAGVVISSPTKWSLWVQIPFTLGVISLLLAFNIPQYHHIYWLASLLLGLSLFGVILLMLSQLIKIPHHSASSKGMIFSYSHLVLLLS